MPEEIPTRPAQPPATPLRRVADRLGDELVELRHSDLDLQVTGLTLSTDRIRPGDLYAAPAGARTHGATYAARAVEAGAVAILTDPAGADLCEEVDVPVLVVESPRAVLGRLGAMIYGDPADRLRLLAVTGTQGKTTTTRLAESALTTAGIGAAVIGTVGTRVAGRDLATVLTTPEAPDLHALFAVMAEQHVVACAMEVSSHALVMGRVDGVVFDLACFTNLGRDHLDFHADEEEYFAAKASLFTPARTRRALVNLDDPHGRRLLEQVEVPVRTFSATGDPAADYRALDVELAPEGSRFRLVGPTPAEGSAATGVDVETFVPLTGDFNVANALCALAGLVELGFDAAQVAAGLAASGGVPGRLERIDAGQPFLAVVDYAHKPDAVRAALVALRGQTAGRLVAVLGAGGDRDPGKRPLMGEVAARLADVVVVTDDNPRSEAPAEIRAAVLAGAHEVPEADRAELHEEGDRRAAIRLAVSLAAAGDVLVVAGKGHETGQEVAGLVHPFDDRAVLHEELVRR